MGPLGEQYGYLATLLSRLYPHTLVGHMDQRKERALDYCLVYGRWEVLDPKNTGVTSALLDTLGTSIKAKADKWGVRIDFGPAQGVVVPNRCMADTLPHDDSVLNQAATALDDIVKTTSSLASSMATIFPILIALNMLSNVRGVLDIFSGGRRR